MGLVFSCMDRRALILPPVNRNDAKVAEHSDLDDSLSMVHCAMQYSKGRAIPIAAHRAMVRSMLRLLSKRASLLFLPFPVLIVAGCSESLTSAAPSPPSFSTSKKDMDKTLTPQQQKAAIADLQNTQAKSAAEAATSDTTASVKPAQAQN
jgi:hypothetical protein